MIGEGGEGRRGAILFVVLLFIAFLTELVATTIRGSWVEIRAARTFSDAMEADELGRAAVDIVTYELLKADGADPVRGGTLAVEMTNARIDVDYVSESARIDVNTAPVDLIRSVLLAAGGEAHQVDGAIGRIEQLRAATPRGVVNASAAGSGGSPGAPGADSSSLQSPFQVGGAWRLPSELAARIVSSLTVSNETEQVDPLLADRPVVLALMEGDRDRTDDFMRRRSQGFTNADAALALFPVPARRFIAFIDVPVFRVLARVSIAHRFIRTYEIILGSPAASNRTPDVRSWRPMFGP